MGKSPKTNSWVKIQLAKWHIWYDTIGASLAQEVACQSHWVWCHLGKKNHVYTCENQEPGLRAVQTASVLCFIIMIWMTPKALIWPSKSPVNSPGRPTIPSPECKGVGINTSWNFTSDERQWAAHRKLLSTWSTITEEVRISTKAEKGQPTNIWRGEGLAPPKIMDQVTWIIECFWNKKLN